MCCRRIESIHSSKNYTGLQGPRAEISWACWAKTTARWASLIYISQSSIIFRPVHFHGPFECIRLMTADSNKSISVYVVNELMPMLFTVQILSGNFNTFFEVHCMRYLNNCTRAKLVNWRRYIIQTSYY